MHLEARRRRAPRRADLEEARDRIEELEAELRVDRSSIATRPARARTVRCCVGGWREGSPEAIVEAAEEEAAATRAELDKALARIEDLEEEQRSRGEEVPPARRS